MTMTESHVEVDLEGALELFLDLNEWVVSFDRIGSRIADGYDPQIQDEYVTKSDMTRRLAKHRRLIGELVEAAIGADRLEELAESTPVYGDEGDGWIRRRPR
ncbi:hypothetical protein ACFVDI_02070 [Nocardioides sp. NPDC057767]|uniref:hypothetical protein n=1 Tax=unclassified Nocardioides TaxID=2615069 RepID=UPI00366BC256